MAPKDGALEENEVDEINQIRNHRNEIAHELPSLLISEGIEINYDLFRRIREILRKVAIFWARADLKFDLETLNEVNMDDLRDEDILSSREIVLDVITSTVNEYLERLVNDGDSDIAAM